MLRAPSCASLNRPLVSVQHNKQTLSIEKATLCWSLELLEDFLHIHNYIHHFYSQTGKISTGKLPNALVALMAKPSGANGSRLAVFSVKMDWLIVFYSHRLESLVGCVAQHSTHLSLLRFHVIWASSSAICKGLMISLQVRGVT